MPTNPRTQLFSRAARSATERLLPGRWLVLAGLTLALAGCGKGEYERRLEQSVQTLSAGQQAAATPADPAAAAPAGPQGANAAAEGQPAAK